MPQQSAPGSAIVSCPRPTMSYLPTELVDHICQSLAGDVYALKSCSLLCTAWRQLAQFALFSTVTAHCTFHQDVFAFTGNGRSKSFDALSSVAPLVSTLVLFLERIYYPHKHDEEPFAPLSLALAMCNVRELRVVSHLPKGFVASKGILPWVHSFPSIQTIHMQKVQFESWHEFLSLPLPRLEHLSLDNILIRTTASPSTLLPGSAAASLPAHTMTVSTYDINSLPTLLAALPAITHLEVPVSGFWSVDAAAAPTLHTIHGRVLREFTGRCFFLQCGRVASRLTLKTAGYWPGALQPQLAAQLEALEITFELGARDPENLVLLFGRGIHLPRLRRIRVAFLGSVATTFDDDDAFEDVLAGVWAPELTFVELAAHCENRKDEERYLAFLGSLFAGARERGILHVKQLD
jgi:hypothetical protein